MQVHLYLSLRTAYSIALLLSGSKGGMLAMSFSHRGV